MVAGRHRPVRDRGGRRVAGLLDKTQSRVLIRTLREQVIAPILAGVRTRKRGRKPTTWTTIDRDYDTLRIDMQTLFTDLGITAAPTAWTTSCRSAARKLLAARNRLLSSRLGGQLALREATKPAYGIALPEYQHPITQLKGDA